MTEGSERFSIGGACPDAELIGAHAEGRLVGAEAGRMDAHLASCQACHEVFADALRFRLEHNLVPLAPAAALWPRPGASPLAWRKTLRPALALAAAAALFLAVWIERGRERPVLPEPGRVAEAPAASLRPSATVTAPLSETASPVSPPAPRADGRRGTTTTRPGMALRPVESPPGSPAEPNLAPPAEPAPRLPPPPVGAGGAHPPSEPSEVAPESAPGAAPAAAPREATVRTATEVTVESASRFSQKLIDAPATMSIISGEALTVAPVRNAADAIRWVPGVNVIQTSARDFEVTPREATSTLATSTLVAVDGRSVYLDSLGVVLWDFVPPASSGEIQQIEVVRGPASVVWGANAVNGVVNFITKTPREFPGLGVVLGAGLFGRDGGSRADLGDGHLFDGGFSLAHVFNDSWSLKLSGGYYYAEPYSRPVGTIPLGCHPLGVVPCRDADGMALPGGIPIGGATYPPDADVPGGYENAGTSQPKLYLRADQDLSSGGRITYEGGFGGTEGIVHTGIGPFDLRNGSYMGFGRVAYNKDAMRAAAFVNRVDAEAPNRLFTDPVTLRPILLGFKTDTYDLEFGNASVLGGKHVLSYGANYRRNNFDVTLADGPDRDEFGAYGQWEYFVEEFRLSAGARADRFSNLGRFVFSPRLSLIFKPTPDQSIRASYNRAFTSPSFIDNYLGQDLLLPPPIDLAPLAEAAPGLAPLVPPPFLLTTRASGNPDLREQTTSSYEIAYVGSLGRKTTVSLAGYVSDNDNSVNFTYLVPTGRPGFPPPTFYGVDDPARGVTLPTATAPATPITLSPVLMGVLANLPPQLGGPVMLPHEVATYLNFGPVRNRGLEAALEHRFNPRLTLSANYSWQDTPEIRDGGKIPFPPDSLGRPPKHRFNLGVAYDGKALFANANLNYAGTALWTDVLSSDYWGFTDAYATINATLGVKLDQGKVMLSLKGTNLADERIQQHIFGDILRRSVVLELRVRK